MDSKQSFGGITALCSIGFTLFWFNLVWINIPHLSGDSTQALILIGAILLVDSFLDFVLFSNGEKRGARSKKIRVVFLEGMVIWFGSSFFNSPLFPENLAPNAYNLSATISFLVCTYVVFGFRSAIFPRRFLYELIEKRDARPLADLLAEHATLLSSGKESSYQIRKNATFILVVSTLAMIVATYLSQNLGVLTVLYLVTVASSLSLIAISHIWIQEHRFFLHGLESPAVQKRIRLGWALALIGVSAIPAVILASNSSLLHPDAMRSFVSWGFGLFTGSSVDNSDSVRKFLDTVFPQQEVAQTLAATNRAFATNPFWAVFYDVLKYLGVAIVAIGVVYFMIRPVLKGEMKIGQAFSLFFKQVGTIFARPFVAFWNSILSIPKIFASRKRPKTAYVQRAVVKPKEYLSALRASTHQARAKRASSDSDDAITIYFRFLEWAYDGGLRWRMSDTPTDILHKTIELVSANSEVGGSSNPKLCAELGAAITTLLEQELFSRVSIGKVGLLQMKETVDQLCSLPSMSRNRAASS